MKNLLSVLAFLTVIITQCAFENNGNGGWESYGLNSKNGALVSTPASANVGIGTSLPACKLDLAVGSSVCVGGTPVGGGSSAAGWTLAAPYTTTTNNVGIGTTVASQTLTVQGTAQVSALVVPGNGPSSFSGNVGIGSASPGTALDVVGTIRASNSFVVGTGAATVTGDANGNVGIGSTNPGQQLDVNGTVRTKNFTLSGNNAANTFVLTATDSAGDANWQAPSASGTNYWLTSPGNVGVYTVNPGYNVGIGSVSPTSTLQVLGPWNVGVSTVSPSQSFSTNGNVSINGGISSSAWTDPVNDWQASDPNNNAATTGTISSGTNSLAVASLTGWSVGMGISVLNAGNAGGTANLITSVQSCGATIKGSPCTSTTFLLVANASHNETSVAVTHDDTAASPSGAE